MSRAKVCSAACNQACKLEPSLSISGVSGQNIIQVEILLRFVRERVFEFAESSGIGIELCMGNQFGVLSMRMKCSVATRQYEYSLEEPG